MNSTKHIATVEYPWQEFALQHLTREH
jgi:hypothetical protein